VLTNFSNAARTSGSCSICPFTAACRSQVGQRVHRFASYRDLIGLTLAEICELKSIVHVLQVHVLCSCIVFAKSWLS
jgi:hypothetical protein